MNTFTIDYINFHFSIDKKDFIFSKYITYMYNNQYQNLKYIFKNIFRIYLESVQ